MFRRELYVKPFRQRPQKQLKVVAELELRCCEFAHMWHRLHFIFSGGSEARKNLFLQNPEDGHGACRCGSPYRLGWQPAVAPDLQPLLADPEDA